MATIKIEPIELKTIDGYDARITGIMTGGGDCFSGEVDMPHGTQSVMWDDYGTARDSDPGCNIRSTDPEFEEAKEGLVILK